MAAKPKHKQKDGGKMKTKSFAVVLLLILFTFALFTPEVVIANTQTQIDIPESITKYFVSYGATATAVVLLTGFIKQLTKIKGLAIQGISLLVSVFLIMFAYLLNVGMYGGLAVPELVFGVVAVFGLANGLFNGYDNYVKGNYTGQNK